MRAVIMVLSGSVAPVIAGLGVAQVLHGHSWGYLMLAAGSIASVPYFVRTLRDWPRPGRRPANRGEPS